MTIPPYHRIDIWNPHTGLDTHHFVTRELLQVLAGKETEHFCACICHALRHPMEVTRFIDGRTHYQISPSPLN